MGRKEIITKYIDRTHRGVEIGPWFSPLAAKRDGFDCLVLDVFDRERLERNALNDPAVSNDRVSWIEDVDLLGSSADIDELVALHGGLGEFDYIISSHNFEHIPNPLKFLQGCGRVLKPGGILSMALPDGRACFDVFRPYSTLGQWIEAFFEGRLRPDFRQVFEHHSSFAVFNSREPFNSKAGQSLTEAFQKWKTDLANQSAVYEDTHCWVFTPSTFELLIRDAAFLGLSPFDVVEVSKTNGNEFYVHLRHVGYGVESEARSAAHYAERQRILSRMIQEPRHLTSLRRRMVAKLRAIAQRAH